jgi:hypothetical protein
LPDEKNCHIVEGEINNEYGISNFFSPKGDGMLPGDIVWDFIKKTGRKLEYEEGHVIGKGAEGFQCKDCKYYMYANRCLLIKGTLTLDYYVTYLTKIHLLICDPLYILVLLMWVAIYSICHMYSITFMVILRSINNDL